MVTTVTSRLVVGTAVRRRPRTLLVAQRVVGDGESNDKRPADRHHNGDKRGGRRALGRRRPRTTRRAGEAVYAGARKRTNTVRANAVVRARIRRA